ncbi:MAG: helix-turn-helix transcriptional regulator [Bacillota bacterium]
MSSKLHPLLAQLIPVANGIVATFGEKHCEVAIHDLKDPQHSLQYLVGSITGRKVGAPITNIVLEALKRNRDHTPDLYNYGSKTKDGKILKSSTIFIRESGKIIGCLCLNFDLTEFKLAEQILHEFCTVAELKQTGLSEVQEQFAQDVGEVLKSMVENVIEHVGTPVALMHKEEKVTVVQLLEERGVFLIKGAVEYVAQSLGVSKYTIYNYLDEVRVLDKSVIKA